MGGRGALILAFFGAVFAALTMSRALHVAGPSLAAPFVVFAAIALAAVLALRLPGPGFVPSERTNRVIMWASIGEGIGIFVLANVVVNLHRPELLLPAIALVVGLHFVPIALSSKVLAFHALAAVLVAAAIIGALVAPPAGPAVAGFASAIALWGASLLAVRRERRAKLRG